jgi:hypothetical protein
MGSKLIRLEDGMLVEVVTAGDEVQQISGRDKIKPILLKTCIPIVESVKELRDKVDVEQVEVEIGLSFNAEGNIYITKTTISANAIIAYAMIIYHKSRCQACWQLSRLL